MDNKQMMKALLWQRLIQMKLHTNIEDEGMLITRVPGGWIYNVPTGDFHQDIDGSWIKITAPVFVPEPKQ